MIDTTNPFHRDLVKIHRRGSRRTQLQHDRGEPCPWGARGEGVQLNSDGERREGPTQDDAPRVLFVSGDDSAAKDEVRGLIESFGYAVIDLGGSEGGGRTQQGDGPLAGKDLLLFADWHLNG